MWTNTASADPLRPNGVRIGIGLVAGLTVMAILLGACTRSSEGRSGDLEAVFKPAGSATSGQIQQDAAVMSSRLRTLGAAGATVSVVNGKIIVHGVSQSAVSVLGQTDQLFFRPALCYALPLGLAEGETPSTGPLPECGPVTSLTAANLDVTPDSNSVNGYTSDTNIPDDTQFNTYQSTAADDDTKGATVLLPFANPSGYGTSRLVLGPSTVTGTAITSASAQFGNGRWTIDLNLTGLGSTAWDNFAQQQFHAIIAIDLNAKVISAPITQPTNQSFQSFNGQVQIAGNFTENQAKTLATELNFEALPVHLVLVGTKQV